MANFNLNEFKIAGRLAAEPKLKQTPSGVATVTISVAVTRKYAETDEQGQKTRKTDFFNVVAWKERAELICQYFHKGMSIYVSGEMHNRKWTDQNNGVRYTSEIVADDIRFVDSKAENAAAAPSAATNPAPAPSVPPAYSSPTAVPQFETLSEDEELPF